MTKTTKNKKVTIPEKGIPKIDLIQQMRAERQNDLKWKQGKSFCLIYYPGREYEEIIQEAYNLFFTENALNPISFPSIRRFENETVRMVLNLMHGNERSAGTMTSGGTESIFLAVKTAADYAAKKKPGIIPEVILPETAHPAFNKACYYLKLKVISIPVKQDFRADVEAMKKTITKNTILLVGSAPSYPHGVIDPLEELSALAVEKDLLFHVDACIGGFMLPFMEKIGYTIPRFDFRLAGVTSISADLHKYGYTAKGASLVLYRDHDLRRYQFFVHTSWAGGIYGSSGLAGSKPGGTIAAAWATLNGIGMEGYKKLANKSMNATKALKTGIIEIPGLYLLGQPDMSILAFTSDKVNIYEVADELNLKGWHFERLQNPAAIHLTVSQIHDGVTQQFLEDLEQAVEKASKHKLRQISTTIKVNVVKRLVKILPPGLLAKIQSQFSGKIKKRTAPMYGMMGALNGSEDLDEIVLDLLDRLSR